MSKKDAREYIERMIKGSINCGLCEYFLGDCPEDCLCNEITSHSFKCSKKV